VTTTSSRSGRLPWAKPAIAFQVEGEALEEPHHVAQPVAPPFEHFDLVVQSFDKAAGLAVDEVVRNQIQPCVEQVQKRREQVTPLCSTRRRQKWMRRNPSFFERAVSKIAVNSSRKV
jgi:hypothetical protein